MSYSFDLTGRDLDEVIMGMVYQGGARANPARQVVFISSTAL